jgi:putative membrane-bound dehydrogenase-like protein
MPILLALALSLQPADDWKAGSSRAVITPDEPMWMSGYAARTKPAEGKLHDLWAKALALQDPKGNRLLVITSDLIGVDKGLSDAICADIVRATGIPREAICLSTSHTHCGPVVRENLNVMYDLSPDEQRRRDAFTTKLHEACVRIAKEAVADLKPSRLSYGNGTCGFAVNRRNNPAAKVPELKAAGQIKGPFDHDVPVLRIAAPDGALRAVLFGYACHNTTLSFQQWCGDYAGFAQIQVEKAHPGATALYFAGCGADQNPLPRGTVELAEKYGRELGESVAAVLKGEMKAVSGTAGARYGLIDLPYEVLPTVAELEKRLEDKNVYEKRRARMLLDRIREKGAIEKSYPYPVQILRIGGLTFVALGGEVVVDYAHRLKKELGPGTFVAGYCNDVMAYIPSLRVLKEGGYEGRGAMVYYGLPAAWSEQVEELIVAKVKDLAQAKSFKEELPRIPPTEPRDALATFRLRPGFRMELVAAEPLVVDPVDMAFDEDGRLFVVEMIDYPFRVDPPLGRLRLLEDDDGDGRMDRSSVYADRLPWPTGLVLHDGGVFVCAAPDILWLKDTDGDRKADVREVVFTGFGFSNVQGLLNNPKWGVDGWIYGSAGSNGGTVRSLRKPHQPPVSVRGRDFRFRPSGDIEAISGGGQFGHTMDDYGRRFVCSNSRHALYVAQEETALRRNPHLPVASVLESIPVDGDSAPILRISPPEPWRIVRTRMRLAGEAPGPIEHGGRVTGYFSSATGITVFRGTALGGVRGSLIIGDVASNIVHRKVLEPNGSTFRARRADAQAEFLASTDLWFRPCNFAEGPDGALYICDMYRECIEHPDSIPASIQQHLDLTSGRDRGRIWRLTASTALPVSRPRLGNASTAELVDRLLRPDAWWRETASRLLLARRAAEVAPELEEIVRQAEIPGCRASALGLLHALGRLKPEVAGFLVDNGTADLRELAAKWAPIERLLETVPIDGGSRVECARRLAQSDAARAVEALARLSPGADARLSTAIAAASSGRELALLPKVTGPELQRLLATAIGARNDPKEIEAVLGLTRFTEPMARGLREGLRASGGSIARVPGADHAIRRASQHAGDPSHPEEIRADAARFLAMATFAQAREALVPLLDPGQPAGVRAAALRTLTSFREPEVGGIVRTAWRTLEGGLRREALSWFSHPDRHAALLEALENGSIASDDVPAETRRDLLSNKRVAQRARALFGAESDRGKVIAAYRPATEKNGDAGRGREVFRKNCMGCHRARGEGHDVGPDLVTIVAWPAEQVLEQILDPSRVLEPRYVGYKIMTRDGRVLDGLLLQESDASVTLRRAQGETETVLRSSIEKFASSGVSLMPEGLEKAIDLDAMADLLAFLRSLGGR